MAQLESSVVSSTQAGKRGLEVHDDDLLDSYKTLAHSSYSFESQHLLLGNLIARFVLSSQL